MPLTPIYFTAVRGTGVTGSIRPQYTGAPVYTAPAGFFLNPAPIVVEVGDCQDCHEAGHTAANRKLLKAPQPDLCYAGFQVAHKDSRGSYGDA
jgi:predicted CXXCH cytochrome family protein